MATEENKKEYYTLYEFIRATGMKYSTAVYKCATGKLKVFQDKQNSWLIHGSEIERIAMIAKKATIQREQKVLEDVRELVGDSVTNYYNKNGNDKEMLDRLMHLVTIINDLIDKEERSLLYNSDDYLNYKTNN